MNATTQLATIFVTSEWEDFLLYAVPVAVMLFVSGLYLSTQNKVVAGVHYLMLFAVLSINLRLVSGGEWTRTFVPSYGDGSIYVPAIRMHIYFFGTLAIDLAMLLAVASPIIAPFSRRLIRRRLRLGKNKLPRDKPEAAVTAAPRMGFLNQRWVRLAGFPLALAAIWTLLMFGNPQWSRFIYIYQGIAHLAPPTPPPDYSGPWRDYSVFGTLAADGWIKGGQKHGEWRINALRQHRTENYDHGKLHGTYTVWNDRGIKQMEYHYKHGMTHGLCIDWWQDGIPLQEFTDRDGVHEGRYRKWNYKGELLIDCLFKNGKVWSGISGKGDTGTYENYGFDVLVQETYRDGVKDGPAKVWLDEYGKPMQVLAEGAWKNGLPWDGTVLTFVFPSAEECRYWVRSYKKGKADGPARLYTGGTFSSTGTEGGTRVTLGPGSSDMTIIARGDLAETMLKGGASRITPVGLWKFCDQQTPTVTLEGTFEDGKPWSGTFPRHGPRGSILDQCTFFNGEPQDGKYYVLDSPKSESVIEHSYQDGKLVGPPVVHSRAATPLPLYLQD